MYNTMRKETMSTKDNKEEQVEIVDSPNTNETEQNAEPEEEIIQPEDYTPEQKALADRVIRACTYMANILVSTDYAQSQIRLRKLIIAELSASLSMYYIMGQVQKDMPQNRYSDLLKEYEEKGILDPCKTYIYVEHKNGVSELRIKWSEIDASIRQFEQADKTLRESFASCQAYVDIVKELIGCNEVATEAYKQLYDNAVDTNKLIKSFSDDIRKTDRNLLDSIYVYRCTMPEPNTQQRLILIAQGHIRREQKIYATKINKEEYDRVYNYLKYGNTNQQ